MSLINMAAAIRPPQSMSMGDALRTGEFLRQTEERRQDREQYGPGGAQAFYSMVGKAADWADTPEKWSQAQQHLVKSGLPKDQISGFNFQNRDVIRAFYGAGPKERTALEQHMKIVNDMVSAGKLTPEQGQQAIMSKLGVKAPETAKPVTINGQLVDPNTGAILGDYRTPEKPPAGVKAADGYYRNPLTGERIFPDVVKPAGDVWSDPYEENGALLQKNLKTNEVRPVKRGGDTNVSVVNGDQPDSRPMANKPPPGYQRRWDETARTWVDEPIPGSQQAADIAAAKTKSETRQSDAQIKSTTTFRHIDAAIQALEGGSMVTGPLAAAGALINGTSQADHATNIQQITTAAALDEIARMRQSSPTGGAVGSLTDGERVALGLAASGISSSQSKEAQLAALKHYRRVVEAFINGEWGVTEDGTQVGNMPTGGGSKKGSFVVDGVTVKVK